MARTYNLYCRGTGSYNSPTVSTTVNVIPPTLTASLSANPNIGVSSLASTITAIAGGTMTGTIRYQFSCDGDDTYSSLRSGNTYSCSYSSVGMYHPYVIITRNSLIANASTTVVVNSPTPPSPPPPPTPTGFTPPGTVCSAISKIRLIWDPVVGATGYRVYRSTNQTGTYAEITNPAPADGYIYFDTPVDYTDVTGQLIAGTTYWYKVTAYNANGESTPTAPVSTTGSVPCAPIPTVSLMAFPLSAPVPFTSQITAAVVLTPSTARKDSVVAGVINAFKHLVQGSPSVLYEFNCDNGDTSSLTSTSLSVAKECAYTSSGTYNPSVVVTSQGLVATGNVTIVASPATPPTCTPNVDCPSGGGGCTPGVDCVENPPGSNLYDCIDPIDEITVIPRGTTKTYYKKHTVALNTTCVTDNNRDVRLCDPDGTGVLFSQYNPVPNPPYAFPSCIVSPVFNPI